MIGHPAARARLKTVQKPTQVQLWSNLHCSDTGALIAGLKITASNVLRSLRLTKPLPGPRQSEPRCDSSYSWWHRHTGQWQIPNTAAWCDLRSIDDGVRNRSLCGSLYHIGMLAGHIGKCSVSKVCLPVRPDDFWVEAWGQCRPAPMWSIG